VHWFQAIDDALLRLINQTWSNPFFDRLMPFASGNRYFIPALVFALLVLLWKGKTRGRLCVLMIALILWPGDSLICNTIKKAVGRPRPPVTHPEVNLPASKQRQDLVAVEDKQVDQTAKVRRPGKTDYNSMPSSHAANWFAATMIVFVYYRRSIRFMLPLAGLVAFSRVYNGVHYPSDVLAGAILGAGYAVAGLWAINSIWQWAGQKWFPLWWEKLPSLVNPESRAPRPASENLELESAAVNQHWLRLGYMLIAVLCLARLAYVASGTIELENDEAYQWLWSKHLALSYYSKPPMIAYAQFLSTSIWGDTAFGVRFFSPLISALVGVLMLRFFAREFSARLGVILLIITTATPLLAIGATLFTIDPLNVLFWTIAMLAGWRASQPDGTTSQWLWTGLWMGLGFLSKYTSLFQLLSWVVFFALWPPARKHLRRPGPYLALLVNLLCALPVLVWNAQHHWVTIAHVNERAQIGGTFRFTMRYLREFLVAELALLNPVFFVATLWACVAFWRNFRRDSRMIFFFSMGAPLVFAYVLQSLHARVLPNWIAPAILPLFCLMAVYWDSRRQNPWVRGALATGLAIGLAALVFISDTNLAARIIGRPLPVRMDPLHRVRGWTELARVVGNERVKLAAEGKPTFIIATHYSYASQLSFYLPEAKAAALRREPIVYFQELSRPENQFYFWPEYHYLGRKGDNAVFVTEIKRPRANGHPPKPQPAPPELLKQFEEITDLGVFSAGYKGQPIWWVQIFACRNLR
jgi:4-amino-4-deoxy-L-arabinose transferase-like glycosyltransferase/membrane-associated phospholipid phosphatase